MSRNQRHHGQQSSETHETNRNLSWLNNLPFYDKLRYLLSINVAHSPCFKYLPSGHGFVVIETPQSLAQLQQTVQEIFGVSLNRFNILAKQMNIKVKETVDKVTQQRKLTYKSKQQFINLDQIGRQLIAEQSQSSEASNQNYPEQFPRDQEAEISIKERQQKAKRQFMKPNIILNRAYSEGNLESRRSLQDVSLQAKLYDQDSFATPQPIRQPINLKKQTAEIASNNCLKNDYVETTSLADRSKLYKQNYDKCSKLIDTTIMELLTAHKSNIIDLQADGLLQKITEIYDMLSDNIENINSTAKCLAKREMQLNGNKTDKKQVLEEVSSIGFKPLNQEN